jgi:ABC-type oligopeptide transport system substrate-binding subunit
MRIKQVSYTAYLAETSRKNRAALGYQGWTMDFPDPSDFFEPTLSSEAIQDEESQNRAFFSNGELDTLLKRAHRERDPAAREAMYRRCEEIVRDEVPWSIGFYSRWLELTQPYVHNYATDGKHTEDMHAVWIDAGARGGKSTSWGSKKGALLASLRPWGRR